MSKKKVVAKYFALGKAKPKSGPTDGDFDSSDIVEAERFEIFFPSEGLPTKAAYIDKIRESGDLKTVERSLYGKTGNVVKFYKFHQKGRMVLNSKEQFDEMLEHVKGEPNDAKIHIKLIPEKVVWDLGPGGKIGIKGASLVNKDKPSNHEMRDSLLIDQKVKDIKSSLVRDEQVKDCSVYRSGDEVYIFCKCGKHIKAKSGRGAKSAVTAFMYEHYRPKHVEESDNSDEEEEGARQAKRPKRIEPRKKKETSKSSKKESSDNSDDEEERARQAKRPKRIEPRKKKETSKRSKKESSDNSDEEEERATSKSSKEKESSEESEKEERSVSNDSDSEVPGPSSKD